MKNKIAPPDTTMEQETDTKTNTNVQYFFNFGIFMPMFDFMSMFEKYFNFWNIKEK